MDEFFDLSPLVLHGMLESMAAAGKEQTIVKAKYADEIGW